MTLVSRYNEIRATIWIDVMQQGLVNIYEFAEIIHHLIYSNLGESFVLQNDQNLPQ